MTELATLPTIDYMPVELQEIEIHLKRETNRRATIKELFIQGNKVQATERFVSSLASNLGYPKSVFNLFSPAEVLERVTQTSNRRSIIVAVEQPKADSKDRLPKALATSLKGGAVDMDIINSIHEHRAPVSRTYHNGIVSSTYDLRLGRDLTILGDEFKANFVLETPVDGYGQPSAYLAMLRMICQNGLVAMAPAFRTKLSVGNGDGGGAEAILRRFIDSFAHDEGFDVLSQRLEMAAHSPASLDEVCRLYKLMTRYGEFDVLRNMDYSISNTLEQYGVISQDQLGEKQRRICPTNRTVYDLINFATEASTHMVEPRVARSINGFVGDLLGKQFDLEGTMDNHEQPQDLFMAYSRN